MITSKEEYLQRLDDIQNQKNLKQLVMLPSDEPRFIIDANSRTITIPDAFTFLGVENDHAAETIYFEIDRYFDQHDLSTEMCVVQFETVDDDGAYETILSDGFYPVTKIDVDSVAGKILFGQTILNDVTAHDGIVKFSVRFYSLETNDDGEKKFAYNFNTLPSSLPIKETITSTGEGTKIDPTDLEILTARFSDIEDAMKESVSVSKESSESAANYAKQAEDNATAAAASESNAKKYAETAKAIASVDSTLTIDGAAANAKSVGDALAEKADKAHTHNYAGSTSVGGAATSANKLNTNAGNSTQPVYFSNGIPVTIEHTIEKNVPSDAKFTDTTYDVFKGASENANGVSGLVPTPASGSQDKFLCGDGTQKSAAVTDTTTAGSATQPVYFTDGKPTPCTYSLEKSVPFDAEFTDTTYNTFKAATSSADGGSGLVPAPAAGAQAKYLRADGTWQTPSNTWREVQDNLTSTATDQSLSAAQGKALKEMIDDVDSKIEEHNTLTDSHPDIRATITKLSSSIKTLELKFGTNTNVTKNPFSVTFETLDDVTVTGVWNVENAHIEF